MDDSLGRQFVAALSRKDSVGLKALLRPDIDFRAMTPGQFWESHSAREVVDDILLGKWFEPSDEITEMISLETALVGRRQRVGYQLRVSNANGRYLMDQQAYYKPDGEKICWLRMMCAGAEPLD
jgi:hypothetical protein